MRFSSSVGIALLLLVDAASAFAPAARCVAAPLPAAAAFRRTAASPLLQEGGGLLGGLFGKKETAMPKAEGEVAKEEEEDDGKMTIEKVASFGIAGVLSIAVAETVFWVLSFPTSELLYFASTGEWIDLLTQEGQLKFLAFTAGWGAIGGVIAQYRTVLTAAAMTPWMDRYVKRTRTPARLCCACTVQRPRLSQNCASRVLFTRAHARWAGSAAR